MAAGENPLRRIRLVYRRSSNTLKIVVIAALVLGTLSLLMLRGAILHMEQKTEELRQQAAVLEQENEKLEKSISQLGTVQSVTELAEKYLGLVDPNTVIFEAKED